MTHDISTAITATIPSIASCDPKHLTEARRHLDDLTKPIGSLGRLEDIAAQVFSILGGDISFPMRRGAYIFAADHGVTDEGVSAYPREVTVQMAYNILQGGAGISVLARFHNADLTLIDVGVDTDFESATGLCLAKVRRGSRNMHLEAAMTHEELSAALDVGIRMANEAKDNGMTLVSVGELGIGNTTAASAIAVALTKRSSDILTGPGTGLDSAGRNRKRQIIEESVKLHFGDLKGSIDPLEVLRCVGGLEIAAMTGFILGAAANRMVVICDGVISTAAAAVAYAISPNVKEYLIAGHCSEEPGHQYLLQYIGLTPILGLGMRLGEGTGAVLAMPVIESAVRLFAEMATFSSAGVSTATE
jgi:nicotinate-nucleotide--dimethylbenzimidazole phosphoribosyltransferase